MLINQVMKSTGLTRKAIYYYEAQGLVSPEKDPVNGYRNYDQQDLERLKRVDLLRSYGFSLAEIGKILEGELRLREALEAKMVDLDEELENLNEQRQILSHLLEEEGTDLFKGLLARESSYRRASSQRRDYLTRELLRLFPGQLGGILAAVNAPFLLNTRLDTEEKGKAWQQIIDRLDGWQEIPVDSKMQKLIDKAYGHLDQDCFASLEKESANNIADITANRVDPGQMLKEARASERISDLTEEEACRLQKFALDNVRPLMAAIGKDLQVISPQYRALVERVESMEIDEELEEMIAECEELMD